MSDPTKATLTSAITGKAGPLGRSLVAARLAAMAVAVGGAVPTAHTLYQSYVHSIPYGEVSHRLGQYDLWVKNFECKINYRALDTGQGTRVDVGACPKSGDIAIKISTASGRAAYEWIPYTKLQRTQASASFGDLLIATAHARSLPVSPMAATDGPLRLAQAGGMQVLCEAMLPARRQIVRIVNEGGKCWRETISPLQGKTEKREEVPCDTKCTPSGK
jgi:hypothetical protein